MVPPLCKQIYGTAGTACLYFADGYIIGMMSIMLPRLRAADSPIKLTTEQESWIFSIPFMLMFPAQCLASFGAKKFGRKPVIISALFPIMICTILFYVAQDFKTLLAAVIIKGLTGGGTGIAAVWVAEACSPKYRGFFLNGKVLYFTLAILAPHMMLQFISYSYLLPINLIPIVIGLVTSFTTPESPAWLAAKGRFSKSKKSYIWFRGDNENEELNKLILSQKEKLNNKTTNTRSIATRLKQYLLDKSFIKANILAFVALLLVEMLAKIIFILYSYDIFPQISNSKQTVQYCVLAMNSLTLVCTIVACIVLTKFKRKSILLYCGVPAALLMFAFNAVSFLVKIGVLSDSFSWLKIALLFSYFLIRDLGLEAIALAVSGEIYPLAHREVGSIFTCFIYANLSFLQSKIMAYLVKTYVLETLTVFAIIMSFCLLYLHFYLPETYNRTLQDIEEELKYGSRKCDDSQSDKSEVTQMLEKI